MRGAPLRPDVPTTVTQRNEKQKTEGVPEPVTPLGTFTNLPSLTPVSYVEVESGVFQWSLKEQGTDPPVTTEGSQVKMY